METNQSTSGAPNSDVSGADQDKSKDQVSYDTYRKVLGEKKKRDQELADVMAKLQSFEQQKKEEEEKILKEKEEFKKLWERKNSELEEVNKKLGEYDTFFTNTTKYVALKKVIGRDIPEKYHKLIDFEKIPLDPNTRQPEETSVRAYADEFKSEFSELFIPSKGAPLPNNAPDNSSAGLTYDEWLKLPLHEKKKRMGEIKNK